MSHQLQQVGLVDFLESDLRPTFVVAASSTAAAAADTAATAISTPTSASSLTSSLTLAGEVPSPSIAYTNPALSSHPHLLDLLSSHQQENHGLFWRWIATPLSPLFTETSTPTHDDRLASSSFSHLDILWTKSTVPPMWVVVGANDKPAASESPRKMLQPASIPDKADLPDLPGLPSAPSTVAPIQQPVSSLAAAAPAQAQSPTPAGPLQQKLNPSLGLLPALTSFLDQDQLAFLEVVSGLDWAATPVGQFEAWPSRLRQLFYQMIADSHPKAIYWGEQRIVIYNHAFSKFCGSQHPDILGKPAPKGVSDAHSPLHSPIELFTQQDERTAVQDEATINVCNGNGSVSETQVASSLMPILDAGEHAGFLHSLQDMSDSRLWERRMNMLFDLSDALSTAHDVKSYWQAVLQGLDAHGAPCDIPVAAIYSIQSGPTTSESNPRPPYPTPKTCGLEGSIGVPAGHSLIPNSFSLTDSEGGLGSQFKQAFDSRELVLLHTDDGNPTAELMNGAAPLRGFGDKCSTAVICPIQPTSRNDPLGFLLLGLNPRRPFDQGYKRYVSLLNKKLSAYLASAILHESSVAADSIVVTNGKAAPDHPDPAPMSPERAQVPSTPTEPGLDLDKPSIQLLNGSLEPSSGQADLTPVVPASPLLPDSNSMHDSIGSRTNESERLHRITDLAIIGISETDLSGRLLDANKPFFELFNMVKAGDLDSTDIRPWNTCVPEEGKASLQESLGRVVNDDMPQTVEIRLNSFCSTPGGLGSQEMMPRWVLATFIPLRAPDGTIGSIHGCFSDVSTQKWQVESERMKKEEALESKRQQENLMDMTSHEMRNPLGAITHCADAIASTLALVQEQVKSAAETERTAATAAVAVAGSMLDSAANAQPQASGPLEEAASGRVESSRLIDECIDNAETIIACAQHQKRIIDDLLTVSKLDSNLVVVTPCTVDPLIMVRNALRMFEVEAKRIQIDLKMTVDQSFVDVGHAYFDFDPSRVKQVLINLLTNALKFTNSRPVRNVSVVIKATRSRPTDDTSCVRFMPPSSDEPDSPPQPALVGREDPVYLMFEVKDSGRGLSADEMRHLFNRFQQASSFTHVKHGGSGLGLFISRRLTELQNGAIGVSSAPRCGSTFVFFIEAHLPREAALKDTALTVSPGDAFITEPGRNIFAKEIINSAPALQMDDDPAPDAASNEEGGGGGEQPPPPVVEDKLADKFDGILIVEDNSINQRLAQRGLTKQGFRVDVASDGLEALEKLQASRRRDESGGEATGPPGETAPPAPFNLVLMDIEMPVQDGLTCARRIRELEAGGTVLSAGGGRMPIIAVSAHARKEQVVAALGAGCDDVLVKPYRMAELMEKIKDIASGGVEVVKQ